MFSLGGRVRADLSYAVGCDILLLNHEYICKHSYDNDIMKLWFMFYDI